MKTSAFDYTLPEELIAQTSVEPRDQARMLALSRADGAWKDLHVHDLPSLLQPGDLLVINDTSVFRARLEAVLEGTDRHVEVFLLHPENDHGGWSALLKPGKKISNGSMLQLVGDTQTVRVVRKEDDGTCLIDFGIPTEDVFTITERCGSVPVPPYVTPNEKNTAGYQTIYARHRGSVAAPTAGFHLTNHLLERIKSNGVNMANVTLHVGLGTFRPMKTETLEAHKMHKEWIHVPAETIRLIQETKSAGKRVVAVGTTTVRALESLTDDVGNVDELPQKAVTKWTRLFIQPGFDFKVVDALLTNFHLPRSTLLVLVSAFAGTENVRSAYEHAIRGAYRFYSFGDAMFIY